MACEIGAGITRDCRFGFGGLSRVLLMNKLDVDWAALTSDIDGSVTDLPMVTGKDFYEYEFEPETGQALQELQTGSASRYVLQTLNLQLANMTQSKKVELENLALADIVAVYEDQLGVLWLYGQIGRGLRAVTLTIDTGTADADGYIATISLQGGNGGYANETVEPTVTP